MAATRSSPPRSSPNGTAPPPAADAHADLDLQAIQCAYCHKRIGIATYGGTTRSIETRPVDTPQGKALLLHRCLNTGGTA